MGANAPRKSVAVFKSRLLPVSETFIRAPLGYHVGWEPELVGMRRVEGGLDLRGVAHFAASDTRPKGLRGCAFDALFQAAGWNGFALGRYLRQRGHGLVHVHFGTELCRYWPLLRSSGLPLVATLHGYDVTVSEDIWRRGEYGRALRDYPRRLREAGRSGLVDFVAVSESIRASALAWGLPEDRVHVRPVGVDVRRFTPSPEIAEGAPTILFVGRLVEKKGLEHLLEAMPTVLARIPSVRLRVVGDGPLREACRSRAERLGLPVDFLGACGGDRVLEELRSAQVLCLPSVTAKNGDAEGLPIVILEAQSCGLPVVTSARGGATEGIRHGETGFAFAEGEAADMASRLVALLSDPGLRKAMGEAARARMLTYFDIARCTLRLEEVYDLAAGVRDRGETPPVRGRSARTGAEGRVLTLRAG